MSYRLRFVISHRVSSLVSISIQRLSSLNANSALNGSNLSVTRYFSSGNAHLDKQEHRHASSHHGYKMPHGLKFHAASSASHFKAIDPNKGVSYALPSEMPKGRSPVIPGEEGVFQRTRSIAAQHDLEKDRPIAVVIGWMGANAKHLHKYVEYYHSKHIDTVCYTPSPKDVLMPEFGKQQVRSIIKYLHTTEHSGRPVIFHCFSTGGYLYGQMLSILQSDADRELHAFTKSIRGQIFDSVVDHTGVQYGLSKALFPNSPMQRAILYNIIGILFATIKDLKPRLQRASELFHNNYLESPSLFYYSHDDDIAPPGPIEEVIRKWKIRGLNCHVQSWKESRHVTHSRVHPKDYWNALDQFLLTTECLYRIPTIGKSTH